MATAEEIERLQRMLKGRSVCIRREGNIRHVGVISRIVPAGTGPNVDLVFPKGKSELRFGLEPPLQFGENWVQGAYHHSNRAELV